jgi:hypothetical protein
LATGNECESTTFYTLAALAALVPPFNQRTQLIAAAQERTHTTGIVNPDPTAAKAAAAAGGGGGVEGGEASDAAASASADAADADGAAADDDGGEGSDAESEWDDADLSSDQGYASDSSDGGDCSSNPEEGIYEVMRDGKWVPEYEILRSGKRRML